MPERLRVFDPGEQRGTVAESYTNDSTGQKTRMPPAYRGTMAVRCRAKTQVPSAKPVAQPKESPNQPDYPCPDQESGSDDSSKTPKGSDAPASRKRDDGKTSVNGRLPPEVIQRIIRGRYANFRSCYDQGLGRDPNLIGRVTVRFVIGRDGTITSIEPVCTSMPDREVVRCVTEEYKPLTFPQPEGGIVTVVYPIMFSPGD